MTTANRIALVVVGTLAALLAARSASATKWEPAYGARLGIGGGVRTAPGDARGGLFELAPQAGMIVGGEAAGAGPMIEFRTVNFRTGELSSGIVGGFSDGEWGALGTIGAGYAWRDGDQNGAILTTSLAYGLVNVRPPVVVTTTIYVSFRHAVTGPSRDELTAGVALGGGFLNYLLRLGHF
jgi:hypothetical protein